MARNYRYISAARSLSKSTARAMEAIAWPKQYRDRAPRCIKLCYRPGRLVRWKGNPLIVWRHQSLRRPIAGRFRSDPVFDYRASHLVVVPPRQRLREQDQDGIDAEVLVCSRRTQSRRFATRRCSSPSFKASMIISPKNIAPSIAIVSSALPFCRISACRKILPSWNAASAWA